MINQKSKRKKYEQIMCLYTFVLCSAMGLPFRKMGFSSCLFFYNFILRFPFPLLVQGKTPSKRECRDHELLNGNAQLCRCASPKVQHLKSCWFSNSLYLLKRSP